MNHGNNSANGFTLVEIMITVAVLGILAAVAIPNYYDNIRKAKSGVCETNRHSIEKAAIMYSQDTVLPDEAPLPSVPDLVLMKYFDTEPQCPSKGVYVWALGNHQAGKVPVLGCSVHYIPTE